MENWYEATSPEFQKRERQKAKELRSSQWWKSLLAKGICHYCEGQFSANELTMDHLIPVARGGLSKKSNLVPACKACNSQKKTKTPVDMIIESWANNNNS